MSRLKGQFNVNTVLNGIIIALITFALHKLDENNTTIIQLGVRVSALEHRVDYYETVRK
jgi:hypothetical protein